MFQLIRNSFGRLRALSDAAIESQLPDFNICTGYKGGGYYKVAAALDFSDIVNVNLITTTGTPDIIEKIKKLYNNVLNQ